MNHIEGQQNWITCVEVLQVVARHPQLIPRDDLKSFWSLVHKLYKRVRKRHIKRLQESGICDQEKASGSYRSLPYTLGDWQHCIDLLQNWSRHSELAGKGSYHRRRLVNIWRSVDYIYESHRKRRLGRDSGQIAYDFKRTDFPSEDWNCCMQHLKDIGRGKGLVLDKATFERLIVTLKCLRHEPINNIEYEHTMSMIRVLDSFRQAPETALDIQTLKGLIAKVARHGFKQQMKGRPLKAKRRAKESELLHGDVATFPNLTAPTPGRKSIPYPKAGSKHRSKRSLWERILVFLGCK